MRFNRQSRKPYRQDDLFVGRGVNPHRLYRSEDRLLAGVGSGLAEYLGISTTATRIALILLCFALPFIPLVYLALVFVLPRRNRDSADVATDKSREDEAFWRTTTLAPSTSFSDLRYRYRDMEERMRQMEAYVTSAKYEFEREIRRSPPSPPMA